MFNNIAVKSDDKNANASTAATDDVTPSSSVAASPYWGASTAASQPEGFSPFVGFCFTINYILGTGFLTVPWAFTQGGMALSTVVIISVGLFSDIAKNFVLETMARAEAMLDEKMRWIKQNPGDEEKGQLIYSPAVLKGEASDLVQVSTMSYGAMAGNPTRGAVGSTEHLNKPLAGTPGASQPGTPDRSKWRPRQLMHRLPAKYVVKHRKFEINALCRVFIGKFGLRLYTGFICLYIYCTLWAYTCVFASAMAKAAPFFAGGDVDTNYLIYAIIFASIVVPMSCMELDEQVIVQVTMTGARFLMLGLMVTTSSLCAQEQEKTENFQEAPMFRPSGIDKMLPIMVFAHIYHHSIPGLAHPVADKKKLSGIYRATAAFSTIAYTIIGLTLGSAFGSNIEQSSNLNWQHFTAGTAVFDEAGNVVSIAWWAKAISLYVLCFPAIDVISAFPLNAITLGNNMMGSFYGKHLHEVEDNRWIRTRFRLIASIPPIIFGTLERQLGTITDYAGTTGFIIGFSFPALLYIKSRAQAEKENFSVSTFYSSYSSSANLGWLLFYFGLTMAAYVVYCLATESKE